MMEEGGARLREKAARDRGKPNVLKRTRQSSGRRAQRRRAMMATVFAIALIGVFWVAGFGCPVASAAAQGGGELSGSTAAAASVGNGKSAPHDHATSEGGTFVASDNEADGLEGRTSRTATPLAEGAGDGEAKVLAGGAAGARASDALRAPSASNVQRKNPLGTLAPRDGVTVYAYIGTLEQDAMAFETRYPDAIKYLSTAENASANWEGTVNTIVARLSDASEGAWGEVDYWGDEDDPVIRLTWPNAGYTSVGQPLDVELDITQVTLVRTGETAKTWQDIIDYRGGRHGGFNFNAQGNAWVKSPAYDGEGTSGFGLSNDVQIRCSIKLKSAGTAETIDAPILMTWKDIDQPGYPGISYYGDADNPYKDYWNGPDGSVSDWNEQILLGEGFEDTAYIDPDSYLDVSTGLTSSSIGWAETPDVLGSATWTRFAATRAENDESDIDAIKLAALSTYLYGGSGEFVWRGYGCSTGMFGGMSAPLHIPAHVGLEKSPATQEVERGRIASFDVTTTATEGNEAGIIPYTYSGVTSNAYSGIVFEDELDPALDASRAHVAMYRTDTGHALEEADDSASWSIAVSGQHVTATCTDLAHAGGRYRMHLEVPIREDANLDGYPVVLMDGGVEARSVPNKGTLTVTDADIPTMTAESNEVEVLVPQHEVEIEKIDADTGEVLAGAVFHLFSDEGCTKRIGEATSSSDGIARSAEYAEAAGERFYFAAGRTVYAKEVEAPSGYLCSDEIRSLTIDGPVARTTFSDARNPARWVPLARKQLVDGEGEEIALQGRTFDFVCQELDEEGRPIGEALSAENDDDGTISFPVQTYSNAGAHHYSFSERIPEGGAIDGVRYDSALYLVTVEVKADDANQLSVEESATRDSGETVDSVEFTNVYRPNRLPHTGAIGSLAIFALAGGGVAAGAALAAARGLQNESRRQ